MMARWVQKDAATLLGISPRTINYKIRELGIELPNPRKRSQPRTPAELPRPKPKPARATLREATEVPAPRGSFLGVSFQRGAR